MKRIALFRFHTNAALCRNRLQLLRLFNPEVDLYGIFGGAEGRFPSYADALGPYLDGLYCLRGKSPEWKWRNSDLALYLWYREQGRRLAFDVLHLIEWDLLLLAPLAELFGEVPPQSVGLAKLRPISEEEGLWDWITKEPYRGQWLELVRRVGETYGYTGDLFTCICAGATLPRAFLERGAGEDIPALVNDEARLALYARAFGFDLVDNGLHRPSRPEEGRFFNLWGREIRDSAIYGELMKKGGRRAFHPHRRLFVSLTPAGPFPNFLSPVKLKLAALHKHRLLTRPLAGAAAQRGETPGAAFAHPRTLDKLKAAVKTSLNRAGRALQPATPAGRLLLGRPLLILGYHSVVNTPLEVTDPCFTPAEQFLREMRKLAGLGYRFGDLAASVARLRERTLDRPTVCITFDDGLCGVFQSAFPVLRELRIPATVFLVTDLVDSSETLWYCRLLDALTRTTSTTLTWDGRTYDLSSRESRCTASWQLQVKLKKCKEPETARDLAAICESLGQSVQLPVAADSPFRMLTRPQIAEMAGSELISFGAHTARHTILTRTTRQDACEQIRRSLAAVAGFTGKACRSFSYPNGRPGDFNEETLSTLREEGVELAVTTCPGWNRPSTPPLKLRRVVVGEPNDEREFTWRVNPLRILLVSRATLSS